MDAQPKAPTPPNTPHIELNAFLKLQNLAATGGQAKVLIRSGKILVNGVVETRNAKKLVAGDKVECAGRLFEVTADIVR